MRLLPQQSILALTAVLSLSTLVACGHKEETKNSDNTAAASAAEAAPPMSATPAKAQGAPAVITENNAGVDSGPDVNASVAVETDVGGSASATSASNESAEGGADNSAMDKITENDQVIDDQPASPNAPRASDEGKVDSQESQSVGNAKVSNAKVSKQ